MLETIAIFVIGWVVAGYLDRVEQQLYIIEKAVTDKEDKNRDLDLDLEGWTYCDDDEKEN